MTKTKLSSYLCMPLCFFPLCLYTYIYLFNRLSMYDPDPHAGCTQRYPHKSQYSSNGVLNVSINSYKIIWRPLETCA